MSGASERVSGGANGPVLDASISLSFYPMCKDKWKTARELKKKMRRFENNMEGLGKGEKIDLQNRKGVVVLPISAPSFHFSASFFD